MSKVTIDDINKAKGLIDEIVAEARAAKDPSQAQAAAGRMKLAAASLERTAVAYEAQQRASLPPGGMPENTRVRVKLTDEQRQMVLSDTGLDLDEVELTGSRATWLMTLRHVSPPRINKAVLRAARRVKAEQSADADAERMLAELEAEDDPKLKAQLAQARRDPNFLGGLLNKAES